MPSLHHGSSGIEGEALGPLPKVHADKPPYSGGSSVVQPLVPDSTSLHRNSSFLSNSLLRRHLTPYGPRRKVQGRWNHSIWRKGCTCISWVESGAPHLPGAQVPSDALVWSHHGLYHFSGFSGGPPNTPALCILWAAVNVLSSEKSTG